MRKIASNEDGADDHSALDDVARGNTDLEGPSKRERAGVGNAGSGDLFKSYLCNSPAHSPTTTTSALILYDKNGGVDSVT